MPIEAISNILGDIHSVVTDVRGNFELVDSIRKTEIVQKSLGPVGVALESTFSFIQIPMAHTRLFSWMGLVSAGYNFHYAYIHPKQDKLAQSLSVAMNTRTFCSATVSLVKGLDAIKIGEKITHQYFQTAFKVAVVVSTPVAIAASALSMAIVGVVGYEFFKVHRFIGEWEDQRKDYRQLVNKIDDMPADQFEKVFRCEKSALQIDLKEFSKPMRNGRIKSKVRQTLINTLENRMYRTRRLMVLNLTGAVFYGAGCWMNIFRVAPSAATALKNISGAWLLIGAGYQLYSNYRFNKVVENIKG